MLTQARCERWESFAPNSDMPCLSCGGVDRHAAWCGPDYLATVRPSASKAARFAGVGRLVDDFMVPAEEPAAT
jgi:hypothetical protein